MFKFTLISYRIGSAPHVPTVGVEITEHLCNNLNKDKSQIQTGVPSSVIDKAQ